MNMKEIQLAKGCEHNYFWTCKYPYSSGQECTGPCKNCTTTQLTTENIICPICDSPVESGYCINKLCVNHG